MFNCKNQLNAQHTKNEHSILGLNIRCLKYHLDEFKVLLDTFDTRPDVIALTETWMTADDDKALLGIEGYQPIEANPRKIAKRRSGGVAFYVKNGIDYELVNYDSDIECSIIKLKYNQTDIKVICVIYRPETHRLTQFCNDFEEPPFFLQTMKQDYSHLWLL